MKKFEKPTFEIVHFVCEDIITTSDEHDNGFIGGDMLASILKNLVETIF